MPAGRPKRELDATLIEKLASIQCTMKEMAAVLECHEDTLRDNYSSVIAKGRERGKMGLRRKQFDVAMNGNIVMLIWLGKQYLGQSDKQETKISEALPMDKANLHAEYERLTNAWQSPVEGNGKGSDA